MLAPGTIACSRCGKALPSVATFCDSCGARVEALAAAPAIAAPVAPAMPTARPGFVAAGRGMSVCHGCGAIAPMRRTSCEVCSAAIGTSLEAVPPRADGARWVQVRTELTCRQCGQRSPLDPLDLDGSMTCGRCGAVQAFETEAWEDALAHAHAVGDLGGPDLDGRNASIASRNPFADLGVGRAVASRDVTGMTISGGVMKTRNLSIAAAPGHPLCPQCGSPLEVDARGEDAATRCPGCGERAQYRFPGAAIAMSPGLVAAIADDLRSDRPAARLDATSAGMVVAIHCPSCGASLEAVDGKHFVVCRYCHTHCRIPSRTLLALRHGQGSAEPWWLLFRGPSSMRAELAGGGSHTDETAADEYPDLAAIAERGRRERAQRDRSKLAFLEQAPVEKDPITEAIRWGLQIGVPLAVLLVVGVLFFGSALLAWARGHTTKELIPTGSSIVREAPDEVLASRASTDGVG